MSRSELERLVSDAEADGALRRSLRHCRSSPELVLAARRLGYGITRVDLQDARREERQLERQERHRWHGSLAAVDAAVGHESTAAESNGQPFL